MICLCDNKIGGPNGRQYAFSKEVSIIFGKATKAGSFPSGRVIQGR